jgi:hypothetical protein
MACCPAITQTFGGVTSTFVPWVGSVPRVEVWYFIDGVLQNQVSNVTVDALGVLVDHGGLATGVIKIS